MFRRSNMLSDPNVPLAVLKDRVCYAVEQEVQNELKEYDITDELYIETSFKYWERFYSCCEQYHVKSSQPIGLVALEAIGAVAIIKKNAYSLLRPCELLEHLMLVGENVEMHHLSELIMDEEVRISDLEDLVKLVSVLSTIEQELSDEDKIEIDTKLYELNIPNVIVSELVSDIISRDHDDNVSRSLTCYWKSLIDPFLSPTDSTPRLPREHQSRDKIDLEIAGSNDIAVENAPHARRTAGCRSNIFT